MSAKAALNSLRLAQSAHRQANLVEAERLYREVLQLDAENAYALHGLGLIASARGEFERSAEFLAKSVLNRPNDGGFRMNLGIAYRALRKFEDARRELQRAVELQPSLPRAHANLGIVLSALGERSEAIAALTRAVALEPQNIDSLMRLGKLHEQAADLGAVIDCVKKLIAAEPGNPEHHNSLGVALEKAGQADAATDVYRKALAIDPSRLQARLNLAANLSKRGKKAEAVQLLEETVAIFPDSQRARFDLAILTGRTEPTAPAEYFSKFFDDYAEIFDQHLEQLGYRAPALAFQAVRELIGDEKKLDILDLGCGTGQAAVEFAPIHKSIVGIDFAPKMIEKARERGLYDNLICGELGPEMAKFDSQFDLVLSLDVFIYVGDLEESFRNSRRALRSGGFLVFSVEKHEGEDFILQPTQRYAHSLPYLRNLAARHGFRELRVTDCDLRKQDDVMIPGQLVVMQKP